MRAHYPVILEHQIHHLKIHLILTLILFININHITTQVYQDTRSIENIRKVETVDHQALIVRYNLTV